jgi:hypothetical protein
MYITILLGVFNEEPIVMELKKFQVQSNALKYFESKAVYGNEILWLGVFDNYGNFTKIRYKNSS